MSNKKIPMRRCIGCSISKPKNELVKINIDDQGDVRIDDKSSGRSVYICKSKECFDKASKKKSIERSLKISPTRGRYEKIYEEMVKLGFA